MTDPPDRQTPVPERAPRAGDSTPIGRIRPLRTSGSLRTTGRLPSLGSERPRRRLPRLRMPRSGVFAFLAIVGPGLITASAGNDAGGVATYASAGAVFRYNMLWALLVTAVSLIVVQEMCARLGAVTGKGLSDLIREQFSLGATTLAMACLLIANTGITVSEFLGLAAGAQIVGIPAWIAVPPLTLLLWYLVTQRSSSAIEKVFVALSFVFLVYVVAAFKGTNWGIVAHDTIRPNIVWTSTYIGAVVALVGTTISPYMQFYVTSAVVEKGISPRTYAFTRADVISGSLFAIAVAGFIIIATGTALCTTKGCPAVNSAISQPQQFAVALKSVAGGSAENLFAIGLFGASMLAAGVLPLSTAYAVCETFGLESGTEKSFTQAPVFNSIFTGMIIISAIIAIIPNLPIVPVLLNLQVLNALMLPILLVFIIKLVNNQELMGTYRNGRVFNVVAYATVGILSILSVLYLAGQIGIGPAA
jgi:NRAMP (natural resistance-associated macrophage protein)-like metal ion transporter